MDLYRFEAVLVDSIVPIVVVAESEEQAFKMAEIELEKHFLPLPEVKEIALFEKKKIRKSAAFVIHE
ncbi:DUF3906 family protein [Bacillus pacificus]|uniref:DUF3906 family protein n=1 Tax=Bacillus pacificus TaxID=2026187 RepID=UPI000B4423EB|nr:MULTISPECIES: DUF3906 family protein [Bacillus cereus group]MDA1907286.1 DUF3906 family protein [Bacillus cereus]MDA2166312.1 DUF3906 family protein [Bacillus cereus]MED1303764.1 DUF3906 family protein [Bacillus pacificus]NRR14931.1 DUF3906 family protein [Bacillus pacificus]OUB16509.1 hypothetical protein BK704_04745 [[Bacillus thuringiensis] serovar konkukian]